LRIRVDAWGNDPILYKRCHEIERFFHRLKGYRRVFSRFEKLEIMHMAFIHFALIVGVLR